MGKIDDTDQYTATLARDLTLKALETQKLTYTGSQPKDLGEAVGELFLAILKKIKE